MKARIVIGANFGDEGKGVMTDYLCAQGAGMVVRFNGGANAGHTVVTPEGDRHVFRHFGSGTLLGIPTFLSQFFVCNPILFFEEWKQLAALGIRPEIYAHPDCLVTTFVDMLINQYHENARGIARHGSCGVGLHETMLRSDVRELKVTMGDLWNGGPRLESQLADMCENYARYRTGQPIDEPEACAAFLRTCLEFAEYVNPLGIGQCVDPVFEGAQGLLLDRHNIEYWPHLTHSSTGMENVRTLCAQAGITDQEIYYISRTYLTRHGAGPLPNYDPDMAFEDQTNRPNHFQGSLRFAPLDADTLYQRCRKDAGGADFKLVLTHCDQVKAPCKADVYFSGPTRCHRTEKRTVAA